VRNGRAELLLTQIAAFAWPFRPGLSRSLVGEGTLFSDWPNSQLVDRIKRKLREKVAVAGVLAIAKRSGRCAEVLAVISLI
jgi:hypothetical protein